ncbi:hypothetical protein SAMN04488601_101888 [Paenibacillus sp. 453mf]|nr:hypothetical protein SAMN04488601_101888 [Paenibacillus sp. 453mf]
MSVDEKKQDDELCILRTFGTAILQDHTMKRQQS